MYVHVLLCVYPSCLVFCCSTPFRREIPSLHDELMARDEAEKRGSITPFLVGVAEGEGLQSGHTHSSESIMTNTSEASMNASRILDESFEHYKGVFDIHVSLQ